jgi:hypothetical protein
MAPIVDAPSATERHWVFRPANSILSITGVLPDLLSASTVVYDLPLSDGLFAATGESAPDVI